MKHRDEAGDDDAVLLMGESINNFRTIQSFGHEDLIVDRFRKLLEASEGSSVCDSVKKSLIMLFASFIGAA